MHGLTLGEFVPAAPLLPVLAELMAYVVAFGLCVLAIYVVKAFFGTAGSVVGWIPWLGSKVKGPLHSIEQKLTDELGAAVAGLDHRMALAWYKLASLAEKIGHEIMANAATLANVAAFIAGLPGYDQWRAFILKVKALAAWTEKQAVGAAHTIANAVTAQLARLEHWTRSQVTALRHSIAVTIPNSIAGLRKRTRVLEREAERDWNLLKKHERLLGIGALTGVVAVVLSRLGLSWARCTNVSRVGKNVCGMNPSLLESLLADTLLIAGTLSIVEFAEEMQGVTEAAVRPILTFWRAA